MSTSNTVKLEHHSPWTPTTHVPSHPYLPRPTALGPLHLLDSHTPTPPHPSRSPGPPNTSTLSPPWTPHPFDPYTLTPPGRVLCTVLVTIPWAEPPSLVEFHSIDKKKQQLSLWFWMDVRCSF